jgi:hypothetical protein
VSIKKLNYLYIIIYLNAKNIYKYKKRFLEVHMRKKNKLSRPLFYNKREECFVSEDDFEVCENTMETSRVSESGKAEYGISSTVCDDGTPFDCGPSGGAISPFTEVNAENQGVISEVPRKPNFRPENR